MKFGYFRRNFGQVAVARAPVADVVSFARQRKAAPWHKYYQGAWKQPALGGGTFTPLNLPVQGYMHVRALHSQTHPSH